MSSFFRCSDTHEKFLQLCELFASSAHNKILNKEPDGFKSMNRWTGSFIICLDLGPIGVLKPRHSSFPCKSSRMDSTTAFASNLSAYAVDAKESSTYMRARIDSSRAKPAGFSKSLARTSGFRLISGAVYGLRAASSPSGGVGRGVAMEK